MVFINSGFKEAKTYRYWDEEKRSIDCNGLYEDLSNAPEHSVIILHGCAHNPTGLDLTEDQWKKVAEIMKVCKIQKILTKCHIIHNLIEKKKTV